MDQQFTSTRTSVAGRVLSLPSTTSGSPSTARSTSDIIRVRPTAFFKHVTSSAPGSGRPFFFKVRQSRVPVSTFGCLLLHTSMTEGLARRISSWTYEYVLLGCFLRVVQYLVPGSMHVTARRPCSTLFSLLLHCWCCWKSNNYCSYCCTAAAAEDKNGCAYYAELCIEDETTAVWWYKTTSSRLAPVVGGELRMFSTREHAGLKSKQQLFTGTCW